MHVLLKQLLPVVEVLSQKAKKSKQKQKKMPKKGAAAAAGTADAIPAVVDAVAVDTCSQCSNPIRWTNTKWWCDHCRARVERREDAPLRKRPMGKLRGSVSQKQKT